MENETVEVFSDVKRISLGEKPTVVSATRHYNAILDKIKRRVSDVVVSWMSRDEQLAEIYRIIEVYKLGGKG